MSLRKTHLVAILGGFAMLAAVTSPAVAQVDPFYSRLLEDGSRELSIDRYEEAVADLRLACFGFLDEPAVLIRGLVLLAVAQEGANESVELQRTLDRVLEVEERFQVYDEASLPEGMTERFERLLLALVSEARIGAIPAFSELVEREQARLVSRAVAQVGDQHVDEDSADPLTILAMARVDLERGKEKRALRRLDELVKAHPGIREARCLRFQANAALRNCEAMVADLSSCWPWPESPEEVRSQLQCLAERREWSTARDLVASLEPEVANEAQIDKLLAKIAKKAPPGAADPEDPAGPTQMAETGEVATEPLNDPEESSQLVAAVPEPSPSERRTLAEASIVVESASDLEEIEEYLERVQSIADSYPDLADANLLTGRLAYRASRWETAVRFFENSKGLNEDPSLQFYFAVSLYEAGHLAEAAETLRRALPLLEPTSFVKSYESKILGTGGGGDSG